MKGRVPRLQRKHVFLFAFLFLFWIILSPSINIESIVAGVIVCSGIVLYSKDILFNDNEVTLYRISNIKKFLSFIWCLIVEVIKANIQVAKIVLSPSMPISPKFVKVPINIKKDFNKVMYGNAITLTPGTLTVDIEEDNYIIHALTEDAANDLIDSILEKQVIRLEVEN